MKWINKGTSLITNFEQRFNFEYFFPMFLRLIIKKLINRRPKSKTNSRNRIQKCCAFTNSTIESNEWVT